MIHLEDAFRTITAGIIAVFFWLFHRTDSRHTAMQLRVKALERKAGQQAAELEKVKMEVYKELNAKMELLMHDVQSLKHREFILAQAAAVAQHDDGDQQIISKATKLIGKNDISGAVETLSVLHLSEEENKELTHFRFRYSRARQAERTKQKTADQVQIEYNALADDLLDFIASIIQ